MLLVKRRPAAFYGPAPAKPRGRELAAEIASPKRSASGLSAFLLTRSVLVLNNVNSHLSEDLATMCEEAGVRLEYLPSYSPDYNLIEESFSALKAWMRRNRELVPVFEPFFEGYMYLAVQMACNQEAARGFFRSASIDVTEEDVDINYAEL
jgi:hypothetical protein